MHLKFGTLLLNACWRLSPFFPFSSFFDRFRVFEIVLGSCGIVLCVCVCLSETKKMAGFTLFLQGCHVFFSGVQWGSQFNAISCGISMTVSQLLVAQSKQPLERNNVVKTC